MKPGYDPGLGSEILEFYFLTEIILLVWLTMKPTTEWKRCRNRGIRMDFASRNILTRSCLFSLSTHLC